MELGQVFIGLLELSGQFGKGTICSISYFLPAALALVFFNVIGNKIGDTEFVAKNRAINSGY